MMFWLNDWFWCNLWHVSDWHSDWTSSSLSRRLFWLCVIILCLICPLQTSSWIWPRWIWRSWKWRTWRRSWTSGTSPAKAVLKSLTSSERSQSSCPSTPPPPPKHGQSSSELVRRSFCVGDFGDDVGMCHGLEEFWLSSWYISHNLCLFTLAAPELPGTHHHSPDDVLTHIWRTFPRRGRTVDLNTHLLHKAVCHVTCVEDCWFCLTFYMLFLTSSAVPPQSHKLCC